MPNRREFIAVAAAVPAALGAGPASPWYRRTLRWGQTNITEKDPVRYDIPWWRAFWKRTMVQGVIINAGGIVAYYPSGFPLQHRAEFLGDRNLYGELVAAAHSDGLVVIARMDSNRTAEDFFTAHPDWFTRDAAGNPYKVDDKYITCVNSRYYSDYLPDVMTEIIQLSKPEGFADNSWSGLTRDNICYCGNCARKFGSKLPARQNWDDPVYRRWIDWNYAVRLENWDRNNQVTKAAGGADCLWFGMNSGSISSQARSFRDCKAIFGRAEMVFLDHQARGAAGFQENADAGKLVHGVLGWDKLAPESMAMYQSARDNFRLASKPAAEARMWMIEGIAGGIQPWWHHIGALQEDRRMLETAEPVMKWYAAHEQYLVNRKPVASVGLVWSQRNTDYYGRNNAADLTDAPYRGFADALVRARIPYVPIHIDMVPANADRIKVLVLPNIAAMSVLQNELVRKFVAAGGFVISTGATSLYDENGDVRADYGLADVFGAHFTGKGGEEKVWAGQSQHSYLRIGEGFKGFEGTDILAYGGGLLPLKLDAGATAPLTFIPPFPILPPETSWMRVPKTNIPGLVMNGRSVFLPADIDRRYFRDNLPDHANLLAKLVREAAGDSIPLKVEGPGLFDCHLYEQPGGRLVLHLVNLTMAGRMPMEELIPVGPLTVQVKKGGRWLRFVIPPILDHKLLVIA